MSRGHLKGIEQHPDMVKALLKTGWELDPDESGKLAPLPEPVAEEIKEELTKPDVEIPEDIETAHHFTKIKIARQLAPAKTVEDSKQAMEIIHKALEARQSSF